MEENEIPVTPAYPPKPAFTSDQAKDSLLKSVASMALFIGAYYVFFNNDIWYVLLLVLVLFIHEMGHFALMKYFGYADVKMFFVPLLGAYVSGEKHRVSQRQRSLVLLAGPVPGIIIGVGLYVAAMVTGNAALLKAANLFLLVNAFNLLPIVPLDGGNLIATLFFSAGEIVQVVFMGLSVLAMCALAFYLESYVLLLIPFFMVIQITMIFRLRTVKKMLDADGIDYSKPFEKLDDSDYWLIRDRVVANMKNFKNVPLRDYAEPREEKQIAELIKSITASKPVADLPVWGKLLLLFTWLFFLLLPVATLVAYQVYKTRFLDAS